MYVRCTIHRAPAVDVSLWTGMIMVYERRKRLAVHLDLQSYPLALGQLYHRVGKQQFPSLVFVRRKCESFCSGIK